MTSKPIPNDTGSTINSSIKRLGLSSSTYVVSGLARHLTLKCTHLWLELTIMHYLLLSNTGIMVLLNLTLIGARQTLNTWLLNKLWQTLHTLLIRWTLISITRLAVNLNGSLLEGAIQVLCLLGLKVNTRVTLWEHGPHQVWLTLFRTFTSLINHCTPLCQNQVNCVHRLFNLTTNGLNSNLRMDSRVRLLFVKFLASTLQPCIRMISFSTWQTFIQSAFNMVTELIYAVYWCKMQSLICKLN